MFQLVPHACRTCGSRIMQTGAAYQCTTCGAHAETVAGVCGCGLLPTFGAKQIKKSSRGFHCSENPAKSARSPAEYVVFFGDKPAASLVS